YLAANVGFHGDKINAKPNFPTIEKDVDGKYYLSAPDCKFFCHPAPVFRHVNSEVVLQAGFEYQPLDIRKSSFHSSY
ncbi:MAG: hypothetical protein L0229_24885, partial [Blastocatellia bacterium]|nr:hypothetical protein [Blastocatellia bacterium]